MKSTLAGVVASDPLLATPSTPRYYSQRRIRRRLAAKHPVPPSEEIVNRLNGIGREYPFCVYYKEKRHDPL